MERTDTDILVSGGGIAGLTAACAFGAAGFRVICVDPTPPVVEEDNPAADIRSTAFLQPARKTLIDAGIWHHLAPFAAPLQIMRLLDAGGEAGVIRNQADFDASDISDLPFGWNLPNWLLRREILNRLNDLSTVTFLPGVATTRLTPRLERNLVMLSNGTQVAAKLVVAADGRNSFVRNQLGIDVKTWRYGQKALVFTVSHPRPHDNVSTEIHRSGGPFTLVPLPDRDGSHFSAVVWMETGPRAVALQALEDPEFHTALNLRACDILGPLKLESPVAVWPIIAQKAASLYGPRTALVAEAAHVVPPIGAQGLNMSLADIQTLLDLAVKSRDDPGTPSMLARYQRARMWDVTARIAGVDMLNRAAIANSARVQDLRLKAVQTLFNLRPLRLCAMKAGLGSA